ncbi:GNAT family N-acetyltransferase [Serratia fonticola]
MNKITERPESQFQVSIATPETWQVVVEMARQERWDLGEGDASRFLNIDAPGFYIGYWQDRPIASISVVNHAQNYAHLGHYIVNPDFRGQGLGLAVWSMAIEHAEGRCIGLDGMPAQEANYQKCGFKTHYHTFRMVGAATKNIFELHNIELVDQKNITSVIDYDASFVGYSRAGLLAEWFFGQGRKGLLLVGNKGIEGVIGLRPSDDGYRVGPFYAANEKNMKALMLAAMNEIPQQTNVTLDIPEHAQQTIAFARSLGFKTLFHTCRMYRGEPPADYQPGINALASLELG